MTHTTSKCTEQDLRTLIVDRFHGQLIRGCGNGRDTGCILEAASICQGLPEVTDDPETLGRPDYRPLNDAPWLTGEQRAEHMIRLHTAFEPWAGWTDEQRRACVSHIAIETVRQIVSALPGLPDAIRTRCRVVGTTAEAAEAAEAARAAAEAVRAVEVAEAAEAAAWAAEAASAARAAAEAAEAARATAVLILAVDIWVAATARVEGAPQ